MEKNIELKEEFCIEVKRFYVPFVAKVKCPSCNNGNSLDLEETDYMSYPTLNKKEAYYLCCEKCDCEYEIDLTLKMSVSVGKEVRKI